MYLPLKKKLKIAKYTNMRANALHKKYQKILLENTIPDSNSSLSEKIVKLDELIRSAMNATEIGRELFTAYNDVLMDLVDSSDSIIAQAAANVLSKQPEVPTEPEMPEPAPAPEKKKKITKEEDEAIGNDNDNKNGVTGTGF